MNERAQATTEPLTLMRKALAMLDATEQRGAAALLQQAIDELQASAARDARPSPSA